jgi:hypothetical protein
MNSGFRIRLASAVAALGLLAVGVSVATAGPSVAAGQPVTATHAQPLLSTASADLAAKALATSGTRVTPNLVPSTLSAVVNSGGTLCGGQGFGVASADHLGTGIYEVFFNQAITSGVYVATVGLCGSSGASAPGQITVVGRLGTSNGLFVETFNSAGASADLGFHVVVEA